MKKLYLYMFESVDEDGKTIEALKECPCDMSAEDMSQSAVDFLSQTDEAYIDTYGFVHEIYEGKDQIFCLYFEVEDDDWYEIVGIMGEYLDDSNDVQPDEPIRQAIYKVYERCRNIAEGRGTIDE